MIRVTVAQTTTKDLKGTSAKTGKAYEMRFQNAYAHTVDEQGNTAPYPEKIELMLEKDQPVYAPGEYQLHPPSLYVSRNGRLEVSARLTPLSKKPA